MIAFVAALVACAPRADPFYADAVRALGHSFRTYETVGPRDPLPPEATPDVDIPPAEHACYRVQPGWDMPDVAAFEARVCFYRFAERPPVPEHRVGPVVEGHDLFPTHFPSTCAPVFACMGAGNADGGPILGARAFALVYGGTREQNAWIRAVVAPWLPRTE